jgi:hypothetical protein
MIALTFRFAMLLLIGKFLLLKLRLGYDLDISP